MFTYILGLSFVLGVQFFPALIVRIDALIPLLGFVAFFLGFQYASSPVV